MVIERYARDAWAFGRRAADSAIRHALHMGRKREVVHASLKLSLAIALVFTGSVAVRGAVSKEIAKERRYYLIQAAADGFSENELEALMVGSGPGAIRVAANHDPDAPQRAWKRPPGWERLDIDTPPNLGLGRLSMDEARKINGVIPISALANPPVAPFVLKASTAERDAAVQCMTTAIYYEAALEPRAGQEAVAQVILNRMRHAGYPKSVCGVVFQGSDRPGCQFSFACDGSMARAPAAWAWRNARDVAGDALNGYVMKDVGAATHYHTSWIMASWTPTLIKVGQIGGHLFFRPTGTEGQPSAFNAAYLGGEERASKTYLIGKAVAAPVQLPVDGLMQASFGSAGQLVIPKSALRGGKVMVAAAGSPDGRVHGVIGGEGEAPMHAMIAMRAVAAQAALRASARNAASRETPAVEADASAAQPAVGAAG